VGPDDFYTGEIAQTMGAYFERIGGYLRYADFAAHDGAWVEPLCVEYRDLVLNIATWSSFASLDRTRKESRLCKC